jgi:UDP-glucose 4-epimerase
MRYLVTGGAGFIGSHLVDALVARGDSVVVLDNLSTGRRANLEAALGTGLAELVHGSTADEQLVDDRMRQADVCMHLASAVGVHLIISRPLETLLSNVRGAETVISAAARHRKRLLFTSTSEIYGKNGSGPLHEESDRVLGSPLKARWAYSTAKSFGEALAHCYFTERRTDTRIVRLFNTVGPRQTGAYGMVLPRFIDQALADSDLTVYGDGSQSRCFIHIQDTVSGILDVAESDHAAGNAYNIGGSNEISIFELARRVIDRVGARSRIRLVPYDEAYGEGFEELGRRKPDTSALRDLTGWRPRRSLEEMIDDMIAHVRAAATSGSEEDLPEGGLFQVTPA